MTLDNIISSKEYATNMLQCPGCENHCSVKKFVFANGAEYFSGNQCERIYGNSSKSECKGVNLFSEKNTLLWGRKQEKGSGITIGIPRALGIYENYPFWHTLFVNCGFNVMVSRPSGNKQYEKGIRSIMADNICFPAKLMHGHVVELIERGADRIFYPWVVFEQKEDQHSGNSFNCPIVSGYSDVLKSSMDIPVPFDSPIISFSNKKLLTKACIEYLTKLGVDKKTVAKSVVMAIDEQNKYLNTLEQRSLQVLKEAERDGRMVIMLAGRPYHTDPLVEHKISQVIADMGIDVITEHAARHHGDGVYQQLNALTQWAYPNRVFKAAYFCATHTYSNLHMVQLTSFGCGPDAFILDEVRNILSHYHKNLTVLKIDDVNSIGSLRLRVRSLVDSVKANPATGSRKVASAMATTKTFEKEDVGRTIIIPYFAEGYSEFLPTLFDMLGYNVDMLPMCSSKDAEVGLNTVNNDVCYPATLVVGSIMRALKSGKYDLDNVAVAITQTGGQCRASNYYALLKNSLVSAGMKEVPVISVATGKSLGNNQPGFEVNWAKFGRVLLHAMYFADALAKLYYPCVVREKRKGEADYLRDFYLKAVQPLVRSKDYKGMKKLMAEAVVAFTNATDATKVATPVGVVGEIYVKYNSFSNKSVINWLIQHNVEVIPPAITGFFSTSIMNAHINRERNIKESSTPLWLTYTMHHLINHVAHTYDSICALYPFYRPFVDIEDYYKASSKVINPAADFGEGWFLPGEICHMAESGVKKVVSLQPFGCIANHIISKGIEKKLKGLYPELSLLYLDFDAGTSEANVYNRLHFMINE